MAKRTAEPHTQLAHQLTTSPLYSHADTHTPRAQLARTASLQVSKIDTNA